MDLERFLAILAATPVVSEADKAKHRDEAESYSPALRARMAAIIAEEEQSLVVRHLDRQDAVRLRLQSEAKWIQANEERERAKEQRAENETIGREIASWG